MAIPAKEILERELGEIKRRAIPLLVITGGWSPAFDATGDVVASFGGGRRIVIKSPNHFPQRVADEFNRVLAAFMTESDLKRST